MKSASDKEKTKNTEWQALVYFCHLGLKKEGHHQACDFDVNTIDWFKLLMLSTYHSIRPLVFQGMSLWSEKEKIPREIFNKLQTRRKQQSYINMDHAREMLQIISLLSEKDLKLIPYKGVVLSELAYGDIGLREMSDIDLLIELNDFSIIKDVLLKRSYVASKNVPTHFEEKFFKQNFEYNFDLYEAKKRKYHVEPHWKVGFRRWQTDLEYHDILPFTREQNFHGVNINMLTPEGLLLTTSLHHGGEDRWNKLKYSCDVASILLRYHHKMDWQFLLKESERLKVRNIILLGVSLAYALFKINIPKTLEDVIQSLTIQKNTKKVLKELRINHRSANVNAYIKDIRYHLSLRQHVVTKIKVLYYHTTQVFVPTVYDINEETNQGKKYWWLFFTKPFRIWQTHIRRK